MNFLRDFTVHYYYYLNACILAAEISFITKTFLMKHALRIVVSPPYLAFFFYCKVTSMASAPVTTPPFEDTLAYSLGRARKWCNSLGSVARVGLV